MSDAVRADSAALTPADTAVTARHPVGLPVLFFTEMWERFSYYGMRALLVLYLVHAIGYRREDALETYAIYTGLVYLTPIIGGYLADRYLGLRKAILVGGLTMVLGHFAMAVPAFLNLALGLLIVGNGFFKPNISTLLGTLYREHDPRRDGGFTIFYMGINLGAFFSPLVAGTLGEKIGWHWGFMSAGVGMAIGVLVFTRGQGALGKAGLPAGRNRLSGPDWTHAAMLSVTAIPLVLVIIRAWQWLGAWWTPLSLAAKFAIGVGLIAAAFGAPRLLRSRGSRSEPLTREDWRAVLVIMIIAAFVILFWMGFEQAGGTMNLFADRQTDRTLFGWEMPASYFQAVNPLAIIAMGPLFAMFWTRLNRSRYRLSDPAKQGFGMIMLGVSFTVMALAQARADEVGLVSPLWLTGAYVLATVGELMLSPIGLSMVTKLAPLRLGAMMMGLWFTSSAIANYLAGVLEALLAGSGIPLYWFLVATSISGGVVLLSLAPWLNRLARGRA
jgi:proton-dependent oligopeptide transporter, POT family